MVRAVVFERFGGPEVLDVVEVPEPHAGTGKVRVRVKVGGLNPMVWGIAAYPEVAARFGTTLPARFGSDYAGVVDEVDSPATGFAVGDRVFGATRGGALTDLAIADADTLWHTPPEIDDAIASALPVAGLTAVAAH